MRNSALSMITLLWNNAFIFQWITAFNQIGPFVVVSIWKCINVAFNGTALWNSKCHYHFGSLSSDHRNRYEKLKFQHPSQIIQVTYLQTPKPSYLIGNCVSVLSPHPSCWNPLIYMQLCKQNNYENSYDGRFNCDIVFSFSIKDYVTW